MIAMTDSCPNCCRRNVSPSAERSDDTQIRSTYRCPGCGHAWITSRLRSAYGTAATGPTPPPGGCTCARCGGNPNSRTHRSEEGEAA